MKWFIFSLLAFVAAGSGTALAQVPVHTHDFYPLKVGHRWIYRSIDLKPADAKNDPLTTLDETKRRYPKVVIEVDRVEIFERMGKDQNKKDVAEKFAGFLLKSTSGGKTTFDHVIVLKEGVHRISVGGTSNSQPVPITPPLLFFKLGINPGDSWEFNSKSGNTDIKGTFTATKQSVRVPLGQFDAVMISHRDGPANNPRLELDYWFASGIGLVKQRIKAKNNETILELERFEPAK